MDSTPTPAAASALNLATQNGSERRAELPSGRSLVLRVADGQESIEIRTPQGQVELQIALTDAGPLVRLRAARLELEASDAVAVRCRRFELETSEATELHSAGVVRITSQELRVRTQDDIHMNGAFIRLNCDEEPAVTAALPPSSEVANPAPPTQVTPAR
jgi:hypothetical protein